MKQEKCREVVRFYRENLTKLFYEGVEDIIGKMPKTIEPKPFGDDEIVISAIDQEKILAHLFYMLDQMDKFLDEGRMEKFFRWLGFVQGVCWDSACQTLKELKDLNKPELDTGEATVGDPSTAEIAI